MGTNYLFSAVKRWQHWLSALVESALNRLAEKRREKRLEELSEEARRREEFLALRNKVRRSLRTRLGKDDR
jgi:hypothetical protein